MWGWVLVIGYLSLLLWAALWAIAERVRSAIVERGRAQPLDLAAADSMTTREADAEREAAQPLVRGTA